MRSQPGLRLGLDADAASARWVLTGNLGSDAYSHPRWRVFEDRTVAPAYRQAWQQRALVGLFSVASSWKGGSNDWRELDLLVFRLREGARSTCYRGDECRSGQRQWMVLPVWNWGRRVGQCWMVVEAFALSLSLSGVSLSTASCATVHSAQCTVATVVHCCPGRQFAFARLADWG